MSKSADATTRTWIAKAVIIVGSIVILACVGYSLFRGDQPALAQATHGVELLLAVVIGHYFRAAGKD
jgi:uncharacterized MnhB-related membrane protein